MNLPALPQILWQTCCKHADGNPPLARSRAATCRDLSSTSMATCWVVLRSTFAKKKISSWASNKVGPESSEQSGESSARYGHYHNTDKPAWCYLVPGTVLSHLLLHSAKAQRKKHSFSNPCSDYTLQHECDYPHTIIWATWLQMLAIGLGSSFSVFIQHCFPSTPRGIWTGCSGPS